FHYRGRESLEVLAGPPVRLTTWRWPCPSHGVRYGRRPAATTGPVVRRLGYGTRPAVPAGVRAGSRFAVGPHVTQRRPGSPGRPRRPRRFAAPATRRATPPHPHAGRSTRPG